MAGYGMARGAWCRAWQCGVWYGVVEWSMVGLGEQWVARVDYARVMAG